MGHHNDTAIRNLLDIAKAGIDRFYSEGYVRWSRENFQRLLGHKVDIEDPCIQSALRAWEEIGVIRLVGQDDCYIEVLKPFP
jgi:hypothetical protein